MFYFELFSYLSIQTLEGKIFHKISMLCIICDADVLYWSQTRYESILCADCHHTTITQATIQITYFNTIY